MIADGLVSDLETMCGTIINLNFKEIFSFSEPDKIEKVIRVGTFLHEIVPENTSKEFVCPLSSTFFFFFYF